METAQNVGGNRGKSFSSGPMEINNPFVEALKNFKVGATSVPSTRTPKVGAKKAPAAKQKVIAPVLSAPLPATSSSPDSPVSSVKKEEVPAPALATALPEPLRGNVSVGQLFIDHRSLLSLLSVIAEKKEKAVCTFFQQARRGKDGGMVRSFLSLHVAVRPGERISLRVISGGTKWLAQRFTVGMEFFLDELLGKKEASPERLAQTHALRVILDEVRTVRLEAKARLGNSRNISK